MSLSVEQAITALDVSIFNIESQTTINDRRSFLALQAAVRQHNNGYVYLECGSHLGGSLLPHVLDPSCRIFYSVDKRPPEQPDERGVQFPSTDNSSLRMIAMLQNHASKELVAKVQTFDVDASMLTSSQIQEKPDLILIDAEHTNAAVFSDFLSIYRLCQPAAIYAFHDTNLIYSGLQNIETFLRHVGIDFASYILPDFVFALATNEGKRTLRPIGERSQQAAILPACPQPAHDGTLRHRASPFRDAAEARSIAAIGAAGIWGPRDRICRCSQ